MSPLILCSFCSRWTSHAAHAQWPTHSGDVRGGGFVSPTFKRGRALLYIFVYDVVIITVARFMCIDLVRVQVGVHGGM